MDQGNTLELLKSLELIVLTVVPVVYAIIYKLLKKVNDKQKEIDRIEKTKRLEIYSNWEHEESMSVTSCIKAMCNYYKDQGAVDLVSFYQLENGTVARSKLCNMFLSCLAEDDRYGLLPKYMHKVQRVPYSQVSSWVEKVRVNFIEVEDCSVVKDEFIKEVCLDKLTKSSLSMQVRDSEGWFVGICVFEYVEVCYNGNDVVGERELLGRFTASINSIFINYHISRLAKLQELKLTLSDIEK